MYICVTHMLVYICGSVVYFSFIHLDLASKMFHGNSSIIICFAYFLPFLLSQSFWEMLKLQY